MWRVLAVWLGVGLAAGRAASVMSSAWKFLRHLFGPRRQCWMYGHNLTSGATLKGPEFGALAGRWPHCLRCRREYKTRDLTADEIAMCRGTPKEYVTAHRRMEQGEA